MSFFKSINNAFLKCFDFRSRANRAEFWYFYLFTIIANTISLNIDQAIGYEVIIFEEIDDLSIGPVYLFLSFLFFIPSFSLYVRRLHDTNRSGFWLLIILLPSVGAMIGLSINVVVYIFLLVLITLIFFFCQKGDEKNNKFGSPSD